MSPIIRAKQSRILPLVLALAAFAATAANSIEVYFSPKGGATDAIVEELGKSKDEVLVAAYAIHLGADCKAVEGRPCATRIWRRRRFRFQSGPSSEPRSQFSSEEFL